MRFALAHDYLTQRGGAERVTLALTRLFPGAPLYTSLYQPDRTFPEFSDVDVRTSELQKVAFVRKNPRLGVPVLAAAWMRTRITDADVTILSSSGWAHGASVPDGSAKIVYCHNPARWLYQTDQYLPSRASRAAFRAIRRPLVRWDQRAARTADRYIANSRAVAERIHRVYGLTAEVLHPPVSVDVDGPQEPVEGLEPGFWLTVARGRGYKNVQPVIDGVEALGDGRLAIVGSPATGHAPSRVADWLGVVSDAQLRWLYANARALISVSYEDFGLTPLEANAFGTPVAVLRAGGFLDSLAEGVSGVWVEAPTAAAVRDALAHFPALDADLVRQHARTFDEQAFGRRLRSIVAEVTGTASDAPPADPGPRHPG